MKIIETVKDNLFLDVLLILLLVFVINDPKTILNVYRFVDWEVILLLSLLTVIATSLKLTGFFNFVSRYIIKFTKTERQLAMLLTLASMFLSMVFINDITIFMVVPFTLGLKDVIKNRIEKFVVFEILGVNAGSLLTPIGNPQNIFIWRKWDVPFLLFIVKMLPVFIISSIV